MNADRKRAVIYTRISLDRTGEGLAHDRQEDQCRTLAGLRGWEVVGVERDTQSAFDVRRRPGWDRVLELVESGSADYILAYQMDRVARSLEAFAELCQLAKNRGVAVVTAQGDLDLSNETGRLLAGILTQVAQFEVERKSTRQKAANLQRAQAGQFWTGGTRPFGYTEAGEIVQPEADLIRQGVADVLAAVPLAEVARRWEASGLRPIRGGTAWRYSTIRHILENPRYAGHVVYNGEVVAQGDWEPILTEAEHVEVTARLRNRKGNGGNPAGRNPMNLLSGVAMCPRGHKIHSGTSRGTHRYTCAQGCVSLPREDVDALIRTSLALTVQTSALGALLPYGGTDEADPELVARRDALVARRDALAKRAADGIITDDEWMIARAPVAAEIEALEAQIGRGGGVRLDPQVVKDRSLNSFRDMPLSEERALLEGLDAEVTLFPVGKGRRNVDLKQHVRFTVLDRRGGQGEFKPKYVSQRHAGTPSGPTRLHILDRDGWEG